MAAVMAGGAEVAHLEGLTRWLELGTPTLERFRAEEDHGDDPLARLSQINVMQQLDNLLTYPWLRERAEAGELELVGLYFDLKSATVKVLDRGAGKFATIPNHVPESAYRDTGRS
jgi:carbonic anhydrase